MKLTGQLLAVPALTPAQRDAMFALMDRHYVNVQRAVFDHDLAEKQWVIVVNEPCTGQLCGFSTQMLLDVEIAGRPVTALYSGDTIIGREHWGDQALTHLWGRLALSLMDSHADRDLYWFLISKGYKTYRFLPVFFHDFYPRPELATPRWASTVIDGLARSRYPADYDPGAGVIRASGRQYRLRAGVADVTAERRRDPFVRFFESQNPGHGHGDELCCLAPLTRANFTRAAYRVIGPEPATVAAS